MYKNLARSCKNFLKDSANSYKSVQDGFYIYCFLTTAC